MTANSADDMYAWDVSDGTLAWSRRRRPEPGADERLIEVAFLGICGSDLAKLTRSPIPSPGHDWRPGHEIVGWDLTRSPPRLVAANPLVPCRRCDRCTTGDIHLCPALRRIGWDLPGGFAEFVVVPERNAASIPPDVNPAHAVLADPLATAVHGVRCGLGTVSPSRLGVIGSGALAVGSAVCAAISGWQATLLVRDPTKLGPVIGHLDAEVAPISEAAPRRFDAVIDAAAGYNDQPFHAALELVRDGGVILVQTAYEPGVRLSRDLREVFRRSLTVIGSFSFCQRWGTGDFAEALELLARQPRWADAVVRTRFPLEGLHAAIASTTRCARRPRPIKAILTASEAPVP